MPGPSNYGNLHAMLADKRGASRAERVAGYVAALADHYGNTELAGKIEAIDETWEGLVVIWRSDPTPGEREFFYQAWESCIGEGNGRVVHKAIVDGIPEIFSPEQRSRTIVEPDWPVRETAASPDMAIDPPYPDHDH